MNLKTKKVENMLTGLWALNEMHDLSIKHDLNNKTSNKSNNLNDVLMPTNISDILKNFVTENITNTFNELNKLQKSK